MTDQSKRGPTRLGQLLSGQGGFADMVRKARVLGLIEGEMGALLPAELSHGWRLARLDQEALVVLVESPAWATRLRYGQPQLLQAAAQVTGTRPRTLRVKVAPLPARPQPAQAHRLSEGTVKLLKEAAAAVEEGPLREALARLARNNGGKG